MKTYIFHSMKEFLLAQINLSVITFTIFVIVSVVLGVSIGWLFATKANFKKNLDKKCPFCGRYAKWIKTMKQVDKDLSKIIK